MILRIFFIALLIPVVMFGTISNALATTDAKTIRDAVQGFMENHVLDMKSDGVTRVEFSITALDNRLAFPDCNVPLQIEKDGQQGSSNRLMLKVGCPQDAVWSIYVPIALTTYREVVVAQQPLQRGSTISTGQVQLKETDVSLLRSQYFTNADALIGKQVRRPIREGTIVTADTIEEPLAIKRGDAITIVANSGPLTVKMQGTAMSDGRIGEQISVRNQSSEKVIKATVKGLGEVVAVM